MDLSEIDPSNLIRDSYQIEGIDAGECRSIFLDWALKLPMGMDQHGAIDHLIATYATKLPEHPMSVVLQAATEPTQKTGRRGGRAARMTR